MAWPQPETVDRAEYDASLPNLVGTVDEISDFQLKNLNPNSFQSATFETIVSLLYKDTACRLRRSSDVWLMT